ncbi:MAG: serine/threonine protein kinase [Acidobacteriia bacterium]|nr:serine/threonine protein kinase [Terriglobia bacterium]
MTPAERSQAQSLFGEILDLPPDERSHFLDQHGGAERSVREAVDELLAEHERRSGLLDLPLFSALPQTQDDVWTGRLVNSRYRIERFVAQGGMSTVYLARDEQLAGRHVIVKFLPAWAPQYAWLKSRFRREMEALARIDHHAVVGVLDTGETGDGLPFLVIEYIHGVTLRSEMARGPMPIERVARLIRQIARAVAAAHSNGVLHRDLKPENVMLELPGTPDERVRLIDFGIARLEEAEGVVSTRTTQFAGTTPYMAPEQLRGKPCPASDTYALGVIAYEMLAGQRPFAGAGPIEIYEQQRAGAGLKPLLARGVPETAARLIVKQLSFRVEDRSAAALEAGEIIADGLLHPGRQFWSRRHTMAAMTAGAFAAVSGGAWWWLHDEPLGHAERVIELPIPSEPLEQGFQATGAIENRVVHSPDSTNYEALRIITTDQGGYYHRLSRAQAAAANRLVWKFTFEAAAEEGETYINLHAQHAPVRYSLDITRRPGGPDIARLCTQINPVIKGIELPLTGLPGTRHKYVFTLQPPSTGAELWVDGVKLYSGYQGLTQYLYHRGPEIGVARYRSARGVGVFWSFRFEIG